MDDRQERLYQRRYYERWQLEEHGPYRDGRLRREDMLTAIVLACLPRERIEHLGDWHDLEMEFDFDALERPGAVAGILEVPGTRPPRQVLDVGCGRGELVAAFDALGVPVLGVDRSAAAVEYAAETLAAWRGGTRATTRVERAGLDGIDPAWLTGPADVVVFLESIEHVDREVVREWFARELAGPGTGLVAPGARVVIGNIWFPVWDPPDHLWGVGRAPFSGEENRRLGRGYWWGEYEHLARIGDLDTIFRSPTNPTVVFERRA